MKSRYIYVAIAVLMIAAVAYPVVVSAFNNAQKGSDPFFCAPLIPCTKQPPGFVICTHTCSVAMRDSTFEPGTINATVGATITWQNYDGYSHTVTFFNTSLPNSGFLPPGHSFSYTLPSSISPGTYYYFCEVHPFMIGLLNVLPSNATT